jgi:DNA-binding transcriptional regulator YhcF (GntR family)
MTPQRARCLSVITAFVAANGFSPTMEEIATEISCRRSTVHRHVEKLEREGRVRRKRGHDRTIEPIGPHGGTPSMVAAAWKVIDAWRENRLSGAELGELVQALDPEQRG